MSRSTVCLISSNNRKDGIIVYSWITAFTTVTYIGVTYSKTWWGFQSCNKPTTHKSAHQHVASTQHKIGMLMRMIMSWVSTRALIQNVFIFFCCNTAKIKRFQWNPMDVMSSIQGIIKAHILTRRNYCSKTARCTLKPSQVALCYINVLICPSKCSTFMNIQPSSPFCIVT